MRNRILPALACAAAVAATAGHVRANPDGVLEYRQNLMQAIGGHMAAIAAVVKGRLPMTAHVATHARLIEEAAKLVPAAFEDEISEGPTDAKPEIWRELDRFNTLNTDMATASAALVAAAEEGDMRNIALAMRDLGTSCGACHKPFRKPKEESYKQPR